MKSSLNDVNSFKFCIICFCSDIAQVSNESDEFHHRTKSLETPTLPLVWMKSIAANRLFFTSTGTPHARTHTQRINTSNDRYVCSLFIVHCPTHIVFVYVANVRVEFITVVSEHQSVVVRRKQNLLKIGAIAADKSVRSNSRIRVLTFTLFYSMRHSIYPLYPHKRLRMNAIQHYFETIYWFNGKKQCRHCLNCVFLEIQITKLVPLVLLLNIFFVAKISI